MLSAELTQSGGPTPPSGRAPDTQREASAAVKLRRVADRRDAMICMARHEGWGADGLLLSVSGGTTTMATVRASIAEAIAVSGGKIEELTARLADATEAASAEILGEELPGEREQIVEATIRNLANMIANNPWLDTPEKVEAYCNQVGMDLANYALGMREDPQPLN